MKNQLDIFIFYNYLYQYHNTRLGYKAGFVLKERSICQRGSLKFGTMRFFFKGGCYNG